MATFEDFVLKLMTDQNFANDGFLSSTSTDAQEKKLTLLRDGL